ncbi:MAG: GatB/YqeY domain-containing protein [Patescibacteria group bacterium]|nr:GatB/YqeY domain-containing protein [Patescibacteria group bacterium]
MVTNPVFEKIAKEARQALKEGKRKKAEVLRYLVSLLQNEEVRKGNDFNEALAIDVLVKEMKRKQESLSMFEKGGREDLIADQKEEIEILSSYLPKMMNREEISLVTERVLKENGGLDFGGLMSKIMALVKGKADGKLVSEVVRERLAG